MDSSMQPLDKALRNQLDRAVRKARPVVEQAAKAALGQLGVGEENPPGYLSDEQRALRRRLRAHARSLGDPLKNGAQAVSRLIGEIAYEHWHRMLFARFLAETELLMYDGVAVTLEECEELAEEEGHSSGWAMAAQLASTMLPQVFRVDSPAFELTLAAEYQRELEELLAGLPVEVFHASDSLGWVYQFWQTDNKQKINDSEVKIGADELPAVTQLFTEPYMVSFLLDNSLGAWWAARRLSDADLASAESEQKLRDKASLPGVPLEYLRFVKDEETGNWTPAAGTFDAWPQHLAELKTLDPCCGSGHFLIAALLMLVPMRMEQEGLNARDAVDAVLRDNLHGLEIDQRCVELAAFALALTAWRYPGAGGYRSLPEMDLACSGLPISAKKEEWLTLAEDNPNQRIVLEELFKQFKDAPVLGSLIDLESSLQKDSLFEQQWADLEPVISNFLSKKTSIEKSEMAVIAEDLAKAGELLQKKYNLIITNVPFRQSDDLSPKLRDFFKEKYPLSKADMATVFHQRILNLIDAGGLLSLVMPQGFIYKDYYSKYREHAFSENHFPLLARLGSSAFEEISGEEVKVILSLVRKKKTKKSDFISQIGADTGGTRDKKVLLKSGGMSTTRQIDSLISKKKILSANTPMNENVLLEDYSEFSNGVQTGDYPRFGKYFWEIGKLDPAWEFQLTTVNQSTLYGGRQRCLFWGNGELVEFVEEKLGEGKSGSWIRGTRHKNKKGVAISAMGNIKATLYSGEIFDDNTVAIIPKNNQHLSEIWKLCSSHDYNKLVREVDQSNKVRGALLRVPFSPQALEEELPKAHTNDPTQWIFHGHPCGSVIWDEEAKWTAHGPLRNDDTVLHVAVARLLGYRWPAELDPEMELAEEQREWVNRCEKLLGHADNDGLVCLPAVRGERHAVDRLETLLADAYGDQWSANTRSKLLESVSHAGKDLESWLRGKFFAQHCKLFQNRPFIWHVWDGLRDGFSALVNYHRLDYKNLETLTYTYLGDWITQQKKQITEGIDGAEARLAAAEALQKSLELILEGEEPYDIFVRWKPLEEQPIGWHPDLNDGVRLNIRPFMTVPDVKKKGAGVLVHKPNIHWKKDRGKDVESAPWYNLGPQLGGAKGDRINDYHLTLAAKRSVRGDARE